MANSMALNATTSNLIPRNFQIGHQKGSFHPTSTAGLKKKKKSQALQAQIGEDYDGKLPLKAESLILHSVPCNF